MMRYGRLMLSGIMLVATVAPVGAWTGSPTETTFTVIYTEPSTNVAGGPPQLIKTTIYYKLDAGTESVLVVTASSPAGGQVVTRQISLPLPPGRVGTATARVTASNPAGESAPLTATRMADRSAEVVPNAPSGLTID